MNHTTIYYKKEETRTAPPAIRVSIDWDSRFLAEAPLQ